MPATATPRRRRRRDHAAAATRAEGRRRSWSASCATGSRRASIAATSSRPMRPAGSSASWATPIGSSRSARPSSRSVRSRCSRPAASTPSTWRPTRSPSSASSHSGEDIHVRTLQGIFRRAGVSQAPLACGSEGVAARRADRGPPGPRRREGRPDPPHVLRPAQRLAAPGAAERLEPGGLLAAGPSVAGRLPIRRRAGLRHDARSGFGRRSTAAASRRSPSRCARSPGPTRSWPTRRRSDSGDARERPAPTADARSATRCSPTRRWSPDGTIGSTRRS